MPQLRASVLLASVGLLVGLFAPWSQPSGYAQAARAGTVEFYHDFRGQPLPAELTWFNAADGKFFRQEPEGLRIVIPRTWIHPWGGIGFRTSFGFGGDFE